VNPPIQELGQGSGTNQYVIALPFIYTFTAGAIAGMFNIDLTGNCKADWSLWYRMYRTAGQYHEGVIKQVTRANQTVPLSLN